MAEDEKLKIDWDIDVIVTNRVYEFVIPEDGVGGRTCSKTKDMIIRPSSLTEMTNCQDGAAIHSDI